MQNHLSQTRFTKICQKFVRHRIIRLYQYGVIFANNEADFNDDSFAEVIQETPVDPNMMSDEEELIGLCFEDISAEDARIICRVWTKFWTQYCDDHNINPNCIVS